MSIILPKVAPLDEDLKAIGLESSLEGTENPGPHGPEKVEEAVAITRGKWKRMLGREKAESRARMRKTKAKRKIRTARLHRKPIWQRTTGKGQDIKRSSGTVGTRRRPIKLRKTYANMFGKLKEEKGEFMKNTSLGRTSSLIEEVRELVATIQPNERLEAMEAFAHVALISQNLAQGLASLAESVGNDEEFASDLAEAAVAYEDLAREAGEVALTLESADDEEVDHRALKEEFDDQTSFMLEGLTLFADLVEGEEEDEDEDEEEEDEDKKKNDKEESVDWRSVVRTLAEKAELLSTKLKGSVNPNDREDGEAKPEHPANGPDLRKKEKGKVDIVR